MPRDFDAFFEELVRERIDELPCPPEEEMWGYIKRRLRDERKNERRICLSKRLKPVLAACVLGLFLIVVYIIPGINVMAISNEIIRRLIVIRDDTIRIYEKFIKGSNTGTGHFYGKDIDDPEIGKIQEKVHFRLLVPGYVPDGFILESVDVISKYEQKETVVFIYSKNDNNLEYFEIIQRSYLDESDIMYNYIKDEKTEIEKLSIDGTEYILINYEEKLKGLLWNVDDIGCEIRGNLSRNDILEVAKSMK